MGAIALGALRTMVLGAGLSTTLGAATDKVIGWFRGAPSAPAATAGGGESGVSLSVGSLGILGVAAWLAYRVIAGQRRGYGR